MNFGKFDMILLITMAISIMSMSFVFPALGLSSAATDENDIPEFDIEADRFDFVGDFPTEPDVGGEGSLQVNNTGDNHQNSTSFGDNVMLIIYTEDDSDGGTIADPTTTVALINFGGSEPYEGDVHEFGSNPTVGDSVELEQSGFLVSVEITDIQNLYESDYSWAVDWQMEESEGNWLIDDIADGLFYIIDIFMWGIGTMFEIATNLLGMLYDTVTFQFQLVQWLTTTYADIISSADTWASIFVAIPGILLLIELAKLTMVAISLLPTT